MLKTQSGDVTLYFQTPSFGNEMGYMRPLTYALAGFSFDGGKTVYKCGMMPYDERLKCDELIHVDSFLQQELHAQAEKEFAEFLASNATTQKFFGYGDFWRQAMNCAGREKERFHLYHKEWKAFPVRVAEGILDISFINYMWNTQDDIQYDFTSGQFVSHPYQIMWAWFGRHLPFWLAGSQDESVLPGAYKELQKINRLLRTNNRTREITFIFTDAAVPLTERWETTESFLDYDQEIKTFRMRNRGEYYDLSALRGMQYGKKKIEVDGRLLTGIDTLIKCHEIDYSHLHG